MDETIQGLLDTSPPLEKYFDGTFGRGGHLSEVMKRLPNISAFAMDQDLQAIQYGKENFSDKNVEFFHAGHEDFKSVFAERKQDKDFFDIMLLDLGVSSPQFDQADRGFSFSHNGPLDMRMNQENELTAGDIINKWSEDELNELFQSLGEVRNPFRVVRAIVNDRQEAAFTETKPLADMIGRIEKWKGNIHPATKYFMALRLEVNRELSQLEKALPDMMQALRHEGRIAVITFHSLEDRIVKNIFKSSELGKPVNKKVIQPAWSEKKSNPRARSAKLRIFQRDTSGENNE